MANGCNCVPSPQSSARQGSSSITLAARDVRAISLVRALTRQGTLSYVTRKRSVAGGVGRGKDEMKAAWQQPGLRHDYHRYQHSSTFIAATANAAASQSVSTTASTTGNTLRQSLFNITHSSTSYDQEVSVKQASIVYLTLTTTTPSRLHHHTVITFCTTSPMQILPRNSTFL